MHSRKANGQHSRIVFKPFICSTQETKHLTKEQACPSQRAGGTDISRTETHGRIKKRKHDVSK
jgi:hypothetical protein